MCISRNESFGSRSPGASGSRQEAGSAIRKPTTVRLKLALPLERVEYSAPIMILLSRSHALLASKSGLLVAALAPALLLTLATRAQDLPAPQPSPVPGLAYEEPFFPKAK